MNMDNNDEEWKKRGIEFKIIDEGNSKMFYKDQMIFEITVICCHMFMLSWANVLLHVRNKLAGLEKTSYIHTLWSNPHQSKSRKADRKAGDQSLRSA